MPKIMVLSNLVPYKFDTGENMKLKFDTPINVYANKVFDLILSWFQIGQMLWALKNVFSEMVQTFKKLNQER